MSEIPNQIDLSGEVEKQVNTIQLSPEQKESFTRFLEAKKQTEKKGILVLSQQELSDLKNLLDKEISKTCTEKPIDTAGLPMDEAISLTHPINLDPINLDPINTFIETQLEESIGLGEIYGDSDIGELLQSPKGEKIQEQIQNTTDTLLFGTESLFSQVPDMSPDAKFNIRTGLQLALIESLTHNPEKLNLLTDALKNIENTDISQILEIFGDIGDNIKQYKEQLDGLSLLNDGEQNAIFMNPAEGKDFFLKMVDGSIDDIKKYIEDRNTSGNITITPEQISKLRKDSAILQQDQTSLIDAEKIVEQDPDKLQSFIEKMKQINPILGAILETFFGLIQGLRELSGEQSDSIKEIAAAFSKIGQDEKSIFSGKHIPEDLFTSTSRENTAIKTHMVSLFGKDPKQEEVSRFFKKDGKFQAFLEAGNLPSIFSSGENLNVALFSANLQAYKNYQDENKKYNPNGDEGKNLLYKDYFQELKSGNLE